MRLALLVFIFLLFSCQKERSVAIFKHFLKLAEQEDHSKCLKKGFRIGKWNDIQNEIYWSCRLNLVNARFIHDNTSSNAIENNKIAKSIKKKINNHLNATRKYIISKLEGNEVIYNDHYKCVAQGHDPESKNNAKVELYYKCMSDQVSQRKITAAKITSEFEMSLYSGDEVSDYFELIRVGNIHNDDRINVIAKLNSDYELCSGLRVGSNNFKKCKEATDEAINCLKKINIQKAKRVLEDKQYCSKQSLIQFPQSSDSLEENSAIKEIYYNKKLMTEKENTKKIYNSVEIVILREKFAIECYKSMKKKHQKFLQDFVLQCSEMAKNWKVD